MNNSVQISIFDLVEQKQENLTWLEMSIGGKVGIDLNEVLEVKQGVCNDELIVKTKNTYCLWLAKTMENIKLLNYKEVLND